MLIFMMTAAGTAMAVSSAPADAAQLVLTEDSIQAVHPLPPRDTVSDIEASCGTTRFGVTMHYRHEQWAQRLHSVRAAGREIGPSVRNALSERMTPTTILMSSHIDRCSRTDPSLARLRLSIVDRPWEGNRMRFLDLWIAPDGTVSNVGWN